MTIITFIVGLFIGIQLGMIILAWGQVELSKTKDWMMVDGKMQWILRTKRFEKQLREIAERMENIK